MKYIGLDAHGATCTIGCLSHHDKLINCHRFETSARNLIDAVMAYPGKKILTVEESHLAAWVKRTLTPYVDKVIICDPKHNKWISHADYANDKIDAIKLARLLRGGYLKEIYHPEGKGERLRSLFLHYYDLNQQVTRFKCKLKAEFRQLGISTSGISIYNPNRRSYWQSRIKEYPYIQSQVAQYFQLIDLLEKMKRSTYQNMVNQARREKGFGSLISFPGAGPVVVTGYLALIDTPHRFSRKNKLWRYAGFSNQKQISDDVVYRDRPTKTGNRVLKWVVMQHFQAAVVTSKTPNRFQRRYQALIARGLSSKTARRTVCRDILASVRAAWRKEESYRELN